MSELKYYQKKLISKMDDLKHRSIDNKYLKEIIDEYTPWIDKIKSTEKIHSSDLNALLKYMHSLKPTPKDKQKIMNEYNKIQRILEQNNT